MPLSDTMFVVAHFHMVMGVAPIMVIFGAIYHWYPKITGRMLNEAMGQFHFWVTFVGAYAIFFPMHYVGLVGVPRRYPRARRDGVHPATRSHTLNAFISVAALIVGFAQLVFLFNLFWSLRHGKEAGGNPWRATTLEWQTPDDAAAARQLGQGAAGRLSLGLRLQRARCAGRFHRRRTIPGRHRPRRRRHERHPGLSAGDRSASPAGG